MSIILIVPKMSLITLSFFDDNFLYIHKTEHKIDDPIEAINTQIKAYVLKITNKRAKMSRSFHLRSWVHYEYRIRLSRYVWKTMGKQSKSRQNVSEMWKFRTEIEILIEISQNKFPIILQAGSMSSKSSAVLPGQNSQPEETSEKAAKEGAEQQVTSETAQSADENLPSTSRQVTPQPEEPIVAKPPVPPARPSSSRSSSQANGPAMRIRRELAEIIENPPPNCSAEMLKDDLFHWRATILGPSGTVYEHGIFRLDIRFPASYPFRPPQIRFITRIYHCNVDSRGVICLDVLNERWSPVMNISKVLLSIWVLIGECNPLDPLVMGIADQYQNNRKEHDRIASYWTRRFAVDKSGLAEGKGQDEKDEQGQLPTVPKVEPDEQSEEDGEEKAQEEEQQQAVPQE